MALPETSLHEALQPGVGGRGDSFLTWYPDPGFEWPLPYAPYELPPALARALKRFRELLQDLLGYYESFRNATEAARAEARAIAHERWIEIWDLLMARLLVVLYDRLDVLKESVRSDMPGETLFEAKSLIARVAGKKEFTQRRLAMVGVGALAGIALGVPGVGDGIGPTMELEEEFAEKLKKIANCTLSWHSFAFWLNNAALATSAGRPDLAAKVHKVYAGVVTELGIAGVFEDDVGARPTPIR